MQNKRPTSLTSFKKSVGYTIISEWMAAKNQEPFDFQKASWLAYAQGKSGMVIAPTGLGKTFSVFLSVVIDHLNHGNPTKGLKLLWVSPLRSLAKDLQRAMQEALDEIGLDWEVEVRNGDVSPAQRAKQLRQMPDILIVTPEMLQLLLAQKKHARFFTKLDCIAVDEWHELLGSKRGVITELCISYLKHHFPKIQIWGITATIGNLEQAREVLIPYDNEKVTITTKHSKKTKILSVLPDQSKELPWAGHLDTRMVDKVIPIIDASRTSLIFTNTRNQAELWYQNILNSAPHLAGQLAIHHGSIDKELREWIEDNLSEGKHKAVVATSSLDLGVDFKPVDTVIQIGSSKGIARFLQRAGRSGHSPFETSRIYFVPTHSLELIEVAALKEAVKAGVLENKDPMVLCYDVLIQFLVSLAIGDGFRAPDAFQIISQTHCFSQISQEEWQWALSFITTGGQALNNYQEYHRVVIEDGLYKVTSRRMTMLHRMNMGAIVSDVMLKVKFLGGGYIGMVEEYFISKMEIGDKFNLAGRTLQISLVKDMTVFVKAAKGKAITPSWMGGRLPLSSNLGQFLRQKLSEALTPNRGESELKFLHPLLVEQQEHSHIPGKEEFLVEKIHARDGYHLFMYPFEGRLVHEVMAALIAYRISLIEPISFSLAMNDYGFELLSDKPIPIHQDNVFKILGKHNLIQDVVASVNATEMAARKFRDIAVISGLVIQNYPGKQKTFKNIQSSSNLIFKVLEEYEPQNLLLRQAYTEVFNYHLEEQRLQAAFQRIAQSKVIVRESDAFTPLSFPIKVDSLRASLSTEELADRIAKMTASHQRKKNKKSKTKK
ncbi:MAG: ligase-associated DNA damage response DEXH box helicase [Weeksellaceae bacterium]|nr:ligase-associated DNA damage response DEXH box helicase [Weeksellaceae bacterium]